MSPGGVQISLSEPGTHTPIARTTADTRGHFRFTGLSWGSYRLEFAADGIRSESVPIDIRSDSTLFVQATITAPASGESSISLKQTVDESLWLGSQFGEHAIDVLPNGRNLWSLLQQQEPSTVTSPFDVAGLQTVTGALFSAYGASWTQSRYRLNGLDVTDSYLPGLPLINPSLSDLSEFQAITAFKPAMSAASGEVLSLATTEPGETLHGGIAFYGSGEPLQSDNMDARLRRMGFPGPERLNSLLDGEAQLGGRLPPTFASLPFYLSASTQQVAQNLGGFNAPIDTGVNRILADVTPWSLRSQRLNLLYSGQHVFDSAQDAAPTVAPSATTRGSNNYNQFQALWTQGLRPSMSLSAGFGAVDAIVSSAFQNGAPSTSTIDLPAMIFTGAAPLATSGTRNRFEAAASLQALVYGPLGSHSLTVGFDWERSAIVNRWNSMGNSVAITVDGAASEVVRWNTPTQASQHVQNVAEYLQDAWRPSKWVAIPVGVRIDTSTGQANGADNAINWTTVQPRAGVVVPLRVPGLLLRGSWARYGYVLQGRYLDFGNPTALGGQVLQWQDLNHDGRVQPQEVGQLLRVFGGPYSGVAPQIERPYTDEFGFGLQENLANRLTASIRFLRRDDHRLIAIANPGVPFSQYTPVQYPDPGNDGAFGSSDDQLLTLYNENPSALGHDSLLLTNPQGIRATYKGFEALVNVHLKSSLSFSASFTAGETLAHTSPGNSPMQNDIGVVDTLAIDPNTLVMSQGRTYFDRGYTGKITACYSAPHGFYLAAVASYFDGVPFGRLLFVNGFNQGPFFVRATPVGHPGGFQTELNSSLDVRLARDFALPKGTLSGYVDIFNLLNLNENTAESALTGPDFLLRIPLSVEAPRTLRLGLAWRF